MAYHTYTVPLLKDELRKKGMNVSGTKQELIKRLEAATPTAGALHRQIAGDDTATTTVRDDKKRKADTNHGPDSKIQKRGSLADTLTEPGWKAVLQPIFQKDYYKQIEKYVEAERKAGPVFPPHEEVYNAFNYTPFDKVRVVIIGQDPYFNEGQAEGLCFSVKKGVKVPPSLNRIYKVLAKQIPGFKIPKHGSLVDWAKQGVLLLNATLTVQKGKPNSHQKCGWQDFTDEVLKVLNKQKEGLVFLLWGGFAQKKGKLIDSKKHHTLECAHPSPMAGSGFNDCKHFKEANDILEKEGKDKIDWTISA